MVKLTEYEVTSGLRDIGRRIYAPRTGIAKERDDEVLQAAVDAVRLVASLRGLIEEYMKNNKVVP